MRTPFVFLTLLLGAPLASAQEPQPFDVPVPLETRALEAGQRIYSESGEPPILALPTERSFPFGHAVPRLQCVPYRACVVALEPGETILGRALGDTARWLWVELVGSGSRPYVMVKPKEFDLLTNAAIVTDRRLYRVELVAPGKPRASQEVPYDSLVSFWYPDDWAKAETAKLEANAVRLTENAELRTLDEPLASDLTGLQFDYGFDKPFRRALPWKPLLVFDDGARTYVRLPRQALGDAPPLVFGTVAGKPSPLEARVAGKAGDWLVIPTVASRFRLVVGTRREQRSLTVIKRAHPAEVAR
jgi:type IV secretion system protein TrbG